MRLKIDTITRQRSATQDGVRDKLGIRAQVLDLDAEADALDLAGQVVEATFTREQDPLPLFEGGAEGGDVEEPDDEAADVVVPSAGRRRNGTRTPERVIPSA